MKRLVIRERNRKLVKFAILLCVFLLMFTIPNFEKKDLASRTSEFLFIKPAFAQSADATFLQKEAGISLYTNLNQTIDLFTAKTAFKTVEKESSNYIIGSASLPNLAETDDVHCFAHKDGWIVIYYLKGEPASKVIDWNYYTVQGKMAKNKLTLGLEEVCNAIGVTANYTQYFHFKYPLANKWVIVIESQTDSGTDSFKLMIPSELTVYEKSWSHWGYDTGGYHGYYSSYYGSELIIDRNIIRRFDGTASYYGSLDVNELSLGVFHTVSVSCYSSSGRAYVAIMLIYRES